MNTKGVGLSLKSEVLDLDVEYISALRTWITDSNVYDVFINDDRGSDWNLLCAMMDRVQDLVCYFKSERMILDYSDVKHSSYVLSDWIVYSLQIHQFIKKIFGLLGYSDNFDDEHRVFFYNTSVEHTDSMFMEYIRSLAVIHPDGTDRHVKRGFQESMEYSPYFDRVNSINLIMFGSPAMSEHFKYNNSNYDNSHKYIIRIYLGGENVSDLDKWIAIHPKEIKQFCFNTYVQLNTLLDALNNDLLCSGQNILEY